MATPKPPVQPMSDGLHAVMSKAFFRVKAHSKKMGVAKTGFSKNRVFRYPKHWSRGGPEQNGNLEKRAAARLLKTGQVHSLKRLG